MGLASIDAFLDLAERGLEPVAIVRPSLRRVRRRRLALIDPERRERVAMLAFVILAHVLFALLMRGAMRPWAPPQGHERPMVLTFVTLRPPVAAPAIQVTPEPAASVPARIATRSHPSTVGRPLPRTATAPRTRASAPIPAPANSPTPVQHVATRADALHATVVQATPQPDAKPPPAVLYDPIGRLLVPPAPTAAAPRDLLARKHYSYMLPGAPHANSPDFRVTPGRSPQDVVNTAGRIVSGMIGGVAARPDGNGAYVQSADRGLHMSGRDSDPCEDIALDMADVNPDDAQVRERAEARYEQSCEGK